MSTIPCLGMHFQKQQVIVSAFEKPRIRSTVAVMKYHLDKYTSMQIKQFCKNGITWKKKCCILLRGGIMWTLIKKILERILFRVEFFIANSKRKSFKYLRVTAIQLQRIDLSAISNRKFSAYTESLKNNYLLNE